MYINIWSIWRVKEHKNLKEPLLKLDDSTGPRPLHVAGWLWEEPIPKLTYKNAAKCSGALYQSKWAWVVFNTQSQMNQCDMLPSDLAGQTAYKQDHKNQCVHRIMQRAVFQADKENFIIRIYLEDIIKIWITYLFRGHNYCQIWFCQLLCQDNKSVSHI